MSQRIHWREQSAGKRLNQRKPPVSEGRAFPLSSSRVNVMGCARNVARVPGVEGSVPTTNETAPAVGFFVSPSTCPVRDEFAPPFAAPAVRETNAWHRARLGPSLGADKTT
jgi:hypothetical protein